MARPALRASVDELAAYARRLRPLVDEYHRLEAAVQAQPDDPSILLSRSRIYATLGKPAEDTRKEWWVEAEALVSMLEMYRLTGKREYYEVFSQTFAFVAQHQVAVALRAGLFQRDIRDSFALIKPAGGPALRIASTRHKLPKAAPLKDHDPAAILAVFFL